MTCPQWHYLELRPGHFVAPVDYCKLEVYGLPEPATVAALLFGILLLTILVRRRRR